MTLVCLTEADHAHGLVGRDAVCLARPSSKSAIERSASDSVPILAGIDDGFALAGIEFESGDGVLGEDLGARVCRDRLGAGGAGLAEALVDGEHLDVVEDGLGDLARSRRGWVRTMSTRSLGTMKPPRPRRR